MIGLIVAAASLIPAPFPQAHTAGFGSGAVSCASYTSEIDKKVGRDAWIWGFWSGANTAFGRRVGEGTDGQGIIGEVAKICGDDPSITLNVAVMRAYSKLHALNR